MGGLGGSPLYSLLKMPRFFGELIYLPAAWFLLILAVPAWRPREALPGTEASAGAPADPAHEPTRREPLRLLPLATWLLLPHVAFSPAATKLCCPAMAAAPALFILQAS